MGFQLPTSTPTLPDEDSYTFTAILTGLEETGGAGGAEHM